jgi:ferredoxin
MKQAIIYYFSGTGNTELVSGMIYEELTKCQYSVHIVRIENVLKNNLKIDFKKYDLIGIGSQVISYGTPNIVTQFIKRFPKENNKKLFIFRTAGGVAPINYNVSKHIISKLSNRGYDVFYERLFSIGSNWIVKFDDQIMKQLYTATKKKVSIMCKELSEGKVRILKTGPMRKLLMGIIGYLGPKAMRIVGKDYRVSKSCNHCGNCIRNCPADNIYEKKGEIKFKFSCNGCLRCAYSCPKQAISFRLFSFFLIPSGYNIKKILAPKDAELIGSTIDADIITSSDIETIKTNITIPPFFENYIKNDSI